MTAGSALGAATEPGVFIDPNSPSAKEYAIPLDSARGELSGSGTKSVSPGTRPASKNPRTRLFGVGITPAAVRAQSRGGHGAGDAARGTTNRRSGRGGNFRAAGPADAVLLRRVRVAEAGGSSGSSILLLVVVLAAGTLGGAALSRWGSKPGSGEK